MSEKDADYESKDLTPTLLRNAGYAIGMLIDRCEEDGDDPEEYQEVTATRDALYKVADSMERHTESKSVGQAGTVLDEMATELDELLKSSDPEDNRDGEIVGYWLRRLREASATEYQSMAESLPLYQRVRDVLARWTPSAELESAADEIMDAVAKHTEHQSVAATPWTSVAPAERKPSPFDALVDMDPETLRALVEESVREAAPILEANKGVFDATVSEETWRRVIGGRRRPPATECKSVGQDPALVAYIVTTKTGLFRAERSTFEDAEKVRILVDQIEPNGAPHRTCRLIDCHQDTSISLRGEEHQPEGGHWVHDNRHGFKFVPDKECKSIFEAAAEAGDRVDKWPEWKKRASADLRVTPREDPSDTDCGSVDDDSNLIDEDPLPSAHADDGFWQWRSYPDGTFDAKAPGAIAWTERLRSPRDVWAVLHGWVDIAKTTDCGSVDGGGHDGE